jgi:hypothetical protein
MIAFHMFTKKGRIEPRTHTLKSHDFNLLCYWALLSSELTNAVAVLKGELLSMYLRNLGPTGQKSKTFVSLFPQFDPSLMTSPCWFSFSYLDYSIVLLST